MARSAFVELGSLSRGIVALLPWSDPAPLVSPEQRRSERLPMSRPARVLLGNRFGYIDGRTENVSVHGLAVAVSATLPSVLLRPGTAVEVEVCAADGSPLFMREAEVRHVTGRTIGLELNVPVPLDLLRAYPGLPGSVPPGSVFDS